MNSGRKGAPYNKASYNTVKAPPSPTNTSPTLTQSVSNSNSASTPSTSPPQPTTPPRSSRSQTRYPDLGRVPLHRRGTSKTYECLEDLLREAGYKETRVFTPEGERGESSTSPGYDAGGKLDESTNRRSGVGALVGFLAGFIPNTAASQSSLDVNREEEVQHAGPSSRSLRAYPPVSPLASKQLQKQKQSEGTSSSSEPHTPSIMTSSIESLEPTSRPPKLNVPSQPPTPVTANSLYSHFQLSHQDLPRLQHLTHRVSDQYSYTTSHRPPLQSRESRTSLQGNYILPTGPSKQQIIYPRPSRATAYLRHMASTPDMPKRHNSTPAHHSQAGKTIILNDYDSEHPQTSHLNESNTSEPPLPRTWLETVTRAVLFGGMGAYIGGPSMAEPSTQHPSQDRKLRPTRSSISQASPRQRTRYLRPPNSRGGWSDRTRNSEPDSHLAPPELFTRIERGRAGKSAEEVSRTQVVCRSAPASRATSRTRAGGSGGEGGKEMRDGIKNGKERERMRRKGKRQERNRLPTLANTKTEGDAWVHNKRTKSPSERHDSNQNRYLSGWGVESESNDEGEYYNDDRLGSSEDEEEELDLAKILVPPKRQNSIKSLRKHLVVATEGVSTKAIVSGKAGRGMSVSGERLTWGGDARQSIQEDHDWDGNGAEQWGRGWGRNGGRNSEDDEEAYAVGLLAGGRGGMAGGRRLVGSGRSSTGKGRLGLPGHWGLIGGGS